MQDEDTGVAGAAEKALAAHAAASPAAFTALLTGASVAGQRLQELLADGDGSTAATTHRMRAFSLLAAAAATSSAAAEQLKHSDALQALLAQLSPADPLSCLVALQLLQVCVRGMRVCAGGRSCKCLRWDAQARLQRTQRHTMTPSRHPTPPPPLSNRSW
jgi:hypothetical protein